MVQGFDDHLVKKGGDIVATERTKCNRIDTQLCSLLWNSLNPLLLNILHSCKTCWKVSTKAKALYTNDVQNMYHVFSDISSYNTIIEDMTSYDLLGANNIS